MKRTLLLTAILALVATPVLAVSALADPGDGAGRGAQAAPEGRFGRHGCAGRFARRAMMRRAKAMRLLRALDLTDEQKTALKSARDATQTVREDAHAQIRAILADAWKAGDRSEAARKAVREKVKGVLESARTAVEPQAKGLVASLSAEQRAKIDQIAKEHGKTVDDAKLLKGVEHLLLMPRFRHGHADGAQK